MLFSLSFQAGTPQWIHTFFYSSKYLFVVNKPLPVVPGFGGVIGAPGVSGPSLKLIPTDDVTPPVCFAARRGDALLNPEADNGSSTSSSNGSSFGSSKVSWTDLSYSY